MKNHLKLIDIGDPVMVDTTTGEKLVQVYSINVEHKIVKVIDIDGRKSAYSITQVTPLADYSSYKPDHSEEYLKWGILGVVILFFALLFAITATLFAGAEPPYWLKAAALFCTTIMTGTGLGVAFKIIEIKLTTNHQAHEN